MKEIKKRKEKKIVAMNPELENTKEDELSNTSYNLTTFGCFSSFNVPISLFICNNTIIKLFLILIYKKIGIFIQVT